MTPSVGCTTADAEDLLGQLGQLGLLGQLGQLPQVTRGERQRYVRFQVGGATFAYSWPATVTLGVKQLIFEARRLTAPQQLVEERADRLPG